jgi:mitogen-activated protein kinase 1/3
MLQEYIEGEEQIHFLYPSGVDRFQRQFAHLEETYRRGVASTPLRRQPTSLPRERVCSSEDGHNQDSGSEKGRAASYVARTTISPPRSQEEQHKHHQSSYHSGDSISCAKSYLKSAANISSSRRGIKGNKGPKENGISEDEKEEVVHELLDKVPRVLS